MIARPALTALGCRSCQHALYRALLSSAAPSARLLPHLSRRQSLPLAARRPFSTDKIDELSGEGPSKQPALQEAEELGQVEEEQPSQAEGDEPWFLQEAPPRHPPSQHKPTLPTIPADSPAMLESMLKYIYEDMGLDDLSIMDLRDLDPQASLGPNLIMLFGTARSERHLHVSSGRFIRYLKRTHDVSAKGEGLIGAGELKTKLRRLRKKAKLLGQTMTLVPGADNGISTGWVCVNFRTTDDATSEMASFDESGRMSGFGSAETGTTIVVQCLTEARRAELNLEKLWKDLFRRNLKEQARVRDEKPSDTDLDQILASKLQLHETPGTTQFEAMQRAGQQHRYFSTSARRLQSLETHEKPTPIPSPPRMRRTVMPDVIPQPQKPKVETSDAQAVWADFVNIQVNGAAMDFAKLQALVSDIFRAPLEAGLTSPIRLRLVDQLLQTGDERGLAVRSREMLVTLITSIVVSPAYTHDLGRAQKNFELLLRELDECPTSPEVVSLMEAYWFRGDYDRFVDAMSIPTRFKQARSYGMYELAFRAAAGRRNKAMATQMIRRLWPEMHREQPPVRLDDTLVASIKACIDVADHKALYRNANPIGAYKLRTAPYLRRRAYRASEMLRVLREIHKAQQLAESPQTDAKTGTVVRSLPELQAIRFQQWAERNLTWKKPKTPRRDKDLKEAQIRFSRDRRVSLRARGTSKTKQVYLERKRAKDQKESQAMEEEMRTGGLTAQMMKGRRHHD